jgi:hypothetical protein
MAATFTAMLALAGITSAQGKPDLRVTAINLRGACRGNANSVQATVQNSQSVGVTHSIRITLRILMPNGGQTALESSLPNGIGPNGNQPVWFNNVSLPDLGGYGFTVTVDSNNTVDESVETNNTFSESHSVNAACGAPPTAKTYTLTVKVYQSGTWQAGQGQWIDGAEVTLSDPSQPSQFAPRTATTNASGEAVFNNVPASRPLKPYTISARKRGCLQVQGSSTESPSVLQYTMGAYNSRVNLALNCNH